MSAGIFTTIAKLTVTKKIVAGVVSIAVIAGISLGAVFVSKNINNRDKAANAESVEGVAVTATTQPETTNASEAPAVITGYELDDKRNFEDGGFDFRVGFNVKLPKIDSNKPGAKEMNSKFDELRDNILLHQTEYKKSADYNESYDYTFTQYTYKQMIIIVVNHTYGTYPGSGFEDRHYYLYEYIEDKIIGNAELSAIYNLTMPMIIADLDQILISNNYYSIENMIAQYNTYETGKIYTVVDFMDLYINEDGKLCAKVDAGSEDDEYSTDVSMELNNEGKWVLIAPVSETAEGSANTTGTNQLFTIATKGDDLNLRAGPGQNYEIVARIPNNTQIEVTAVQGNWAYTAYNGKSGWVSMDYISIASSSESVANIANEVISVYYNGVKIPLSSNPVIKNDTAYVPMREVFEAMGCTVTWDGKSDSFKVDRDGRTVTGIINKSEIYIGNSGSDIINQIAGITDYPILINKLIFIPFTLIDDFVKCNNIKCDYIAKTLTII